MSDQVASVREQRQKQSLYASRVRIHPKSVKGTARRIKWTLLSLCLSIYYFVPWLRWDRGSGFPSQAVLLDVTGRRAWFFWIEIRPQDIWVVTALLIIAAVSLFLVTSLLGRVWCGYTCPQTVWTDLFLLIERLVEGDRTQRLRMDAAARTPRWWLLKIIKHMIWIVISAATGGAWVLWFNDAPTLVYDLATFNVPLTTLAFMGLFTGTTYLLAGWAREQVCTYMCPWPRFQAAMLDEHSRVVTYEEWRGEPRGSHRAGTGWEGRGDCVDCRQCVAVCPTGIDIRDGQQMECIGCGLCIDACNQIMDRVGRPRGLITWDTLARQKARAEGATPAPQQLLRPRTLIYVALLAVLVGGLATGLALRPQVTLTILPDRNPLYITLADGRVRNAYTVKIENRTRDAQIWNLSIDGLPGAELVLPAIAKDQTLDKTVMEVRPDTVGTFRALVTLPRDAVTATAVSFSFRLSSPSGVAAASATKFQGPDRR